MANFQAKKINFDEINGGKRYENGNIVDANAINAPIEASAYAQSLAENPPDISEVGNVGSPSVSIISYGNGGVRFKFSSLRGEKGENGKNGYTPRLGIDFFTPAEKAEIVQMVLAELGESGGGGVGGDAPQLSPVFEGKTVTGVSYDLQAPVYGNTYTAVNDETDEKVTATAIKNPYDMTELRFTFANGLHINYQGDGWYCFQDGLEGSNNATIKFSLYLHT